jgi:hypothetical protein
MKTWKVKTRGRIERFLIVFVIPIILEFWGVELPLLEKKLCEFTYTKKKTDIIPFENLKYSYSADNKKFNSITFFTSFIGTRGQIVTNKISEIVGFKFTFSWNTRQVNEIHTLLNQRNRLVNPIYQ